MKYRNNKFLARLFYWLFLKETTPELYDTIGYGRDQVRTPTEIGFIFLKAWHYLNGK